jgi:signal peptidase II
MIQEPVMEKPSRAFSKGDIGRLALLLVTLVTDQVTKYLARVNFGLPNGEPDYFKVMQVVGEWVQIRLVFNSGAAFGMKPQSILPFMNPTLFYSITSAIAITALIFYYRHLRPQDRWQKAGLALILSGAFGNLIDRLKFHKVTDFIDVGIPSWTYRWPTFNVADSCVCIGVGLIIIAPMFIKNRAPGAGS